MSAAARALESLMPSPTIATTLPSAFQRKTSSSFSSGVTSARYSSPSRPALARAALGRSPVIITIRLAPSRRRPSTTDTALLRAAAKNPRNPRTSRSLAT